MIKQTLILFLALSITYLPSLSHAEEPFIGIGALGLNHKEDGGVSAKPTSIKVTLGSRVARNWIMEAYYLSPLDGDDITADSGTVFEVNYDKAYGASLSYAKRLGLLTLYGGINGTAVDFKAEVTDASASGANATEIAALNAANSKDTLLSPGFQVGADFNFYKNVSVDLKFQRYYWDSDATGDGIGAELRYHF